MICLHHSDLDGHASAAIVRRKFPECEFISINYGDNVPWDRIKDQDIVMVDFSLQPFSDMIRLRKESKSFIWIDHHKTAIQEYEANKEEFTWGVKGHHLAITYDITHAGCELTWQHFFPKEA